MIMGVCGEHNGHAYIQRMYGVAIVCNRGPNKF